MRLIFHIKRQIHCIFLFACLLLLPACSSDNGQKRWVIALSQCSEDDWRTAMNQDVLREASFHDNVEIRIKSVQDDTQQQIRDIEGFISAKVDLIIVAPKEAAPLTPVIEKAMDAGIPVILADRKINSKQYSAFVGADNFQVGYDVGMYVAEQLGGKGRVFEIQGLAGSTPADERSAGFRSVLQQYPDIRIVAAKDGEWLRSNAKQHTRNLIESQQTVELIFAHNDQMALGAYQAFQEEEMERPYIVGIDALPGDVGGIQMVLDGILDATFIYPTGGERVVQTALRILQNEAYSRENLLYTAIVDPSNARVLKLQTDQISAQQSRIGNLNQVLNENLKQYATQRILFFGSLLVITFILSLLALLIRANRKSNHTNQLLETKNIAINRQKEELAEQRDQLILLSKNLEEATQAKLVFFTNVSHEFRAPLTLISGPLDNLIENESLSDNGKTMAQLIKKNVRILKLLIDEIIDFRKVENGKMQMYFSFGDFRHFLQEAVLSFKDLAHRKHIHLDIHLSDDDFTFWFDPEKMEKVLYNLLSNAFKYTAVNGKVNVSLEKVTIDGETMAKISVADTGRGIPDEHINHIFERFYRASDMVAGSGIGLALTKALIEMHNGTIFVESEEGKGSVFTTLLPFKQLNTTIPENPPTLQMAEEVNNELIALHVEDAFETSESSNRERAADKPLLLLVEDNDDVRLYIRSMLQAEYAIIEARNGQKGLQQAMKQMPDLIISDVMMDVMDGFELCKQLRGNLSTSHIPIILLTACSLDEQRVIGFENGADAYIPKPFNEKLLRIRIRKMIENREILKSYFQKNLTFGEQKESVTEIDKSFIEKFRHIVEENLSNNNLTVDDIGKVIGLSRIQLYRKIKSLTNYAPNELIRTIRLKAAEKMLVSTEKNISEIAYDTGFSSPSYFTKCFKDYFNESPIDYLNRMRK